MSKGKWVVEHVGYPTTNRILPGDWHEYSRHTSRRAAYKAIRRYRSHLDYGQWDDHYRVVTPAGEIDNWQEYQAEEHDRFMGRWGGASWKS